MVNAARDLGGQLNLGAVMTGATLAGRFRRAIAMAWALAFKPWNQNDKQALVNMLILPVACYGSEVAPPPEDLACQLSTAIAACLGPHNRSTCNAITYLTITKNTCELGAYMLQRKCKLLRRIIANTLG